MRIATLRFLERRERRARPLQIQQQLAEHFADRDDPARHHDVLLGLVLAIGRSPHELHSLFVPAFGTRDPGTDRVDLDVGLLDPVVLLLRDHRFAQLAETRGLDLRRRRIAASRRAESSCVRVDGFAFREWRSSRTPDSRDAA